ncbi:Gfo/Idh/MocA family oxidoreductase [Paenibacillus rhizovicinus]|uniref:Gfo/Idh/MocA family oxidoreductase n=1 Tax=Paenibacillus rhizovicinus TaxID=2704463 RepID=A0A6C0NYX1_9BACL|nr:Gfo/Idh/MocA family oxidoreductase [Paenibacillus rhizovicinus]QHW31418.1 Gfo/Idh/MocA family oxidoreductase [Paenibacillus rhizovicinus]
MSQSILKVGIIGQGRSGRDIHGATLSKLPDNYQIAAVADSLPERRKRAEQEFGCRAYATWQEMVASETLDLVVNASPSHEHVPISLELLNRGVNVLCEKPLARTSAEVDQLIEASERTGNILAVFQQSRYMPAYVRIREVIESGVLGRIVQLDFTSSRFARRWDWQTLQQNNGGSLLNLGSHVLDQALQLFGNDIMPEVTCIMDQANTYGDAEDYVKLLLRGEGRPSVDMEVSSCSLFPGDQFVIQGTNGGLRGNGERLEWRYFKPEEAPAQQLITEPLVDRNGLPAYCRETLVWHEDKWELSLPDGKDEYRYMAEQLYFMLHRAIEGGDKLEITPQQVRQQLAVIEACRQQNPHIYKQNTEPVRG